MKRRLAAEVRITREQQRTVPHVGLVAAAEAIDQLERQAEALGVEFDESEVTIRTTLRAEVEVPEAFGWSLFKFMLSRIANSLWGPRTALAFATVSIAALATCAPHRASTVQAPAEPQVVVAAPDMEPEVWSPRNAEGVEQDLTRTIPSKPFKGQATPPCAEDETSINGACWVEVVRKPKHDQCGSKFFLHEGRCFLPVQKAQPLPRSTWP